MELKSELIPSISFPGSGLKQERSIVMESFLIAAALDSVLEILTKSEVLSHVTIKKMEVSASRVLESVICSSLLVLI